MKYNILLFESTTLATYTEDVHEMTKHEPKTAAGIRLTGDVPEVTGEKGCCGNRHHSS